MVVLNTRCLALAMVVAAAATLMNPDLGVAAQCGGSIPDLVQQCSAYVKITGPKVAPSKECCGEVTKFDIPCVCRLITRDVEKLVSMEKVVYVARTCGVTVQPGLKCGSYTVPPKRMI